MRLQLVGGAYQGRSTNAEPEDCINLFYEKGSDQQSEGTLTNVPGCIEFAELPTGEVRGMRAFGSYLYVVKSSNLYRVDELGNYVDLGIVSSTTGIVSMSDNGIKNGEQISIADGKELKVFTRSTGVITTVASENTSLVAFLDGYTVFPQDNSGQFWWTATYDSTTIDPLDFATAEGKPDNIISIIADRRELWLLGEETTEVWYNSGSAGTFTRFHTGFNHMGCAARHSVARLDNGIVWLGKNDKGKGVVTISYDYKPKILTAEHPQVTYQIAQYAKIDDAFGYVYQHEGHEFYVLTFPTENVTWVYDAATKQWHKRAHAINSTFPNRERYNCYAFAFGKHLVGDYDNGKIYELNSNYFTMDGEIIPNIRTTRGHRDKDEERIRVRKVQVTGEEGMGGEVGLEYSKDGGHTFSNEIRKSFGLVGKYSARAIWRKLGEGRDWVFRITRREDAKTIYTGLTAKEHGEP